MPPTDHGVAPKTHGAYATPSVVALLSIALAGCLIDVDLSNTTLLCSDNRCPDGLVCRDKRCVSPAAADASPDSVVAPDGSLAFDAAPPVCSSECSLVAGTDLCFCDVTMAWVDARTYCEDLGSVLARIDDATTAMLIREHVADLPTSVFPWIGGTDELTEGTWLWISNGDLFWTGVADGSAPPGVFTDFNTGEPNQFMDNNEDCLQATEVGWNDGQCQRLYPLYCAAL